MDIKQLVVPSLRDYDFYEAAGQDYKIILNANEHYENFLNTKLQEEFIEGIKKININRYPNANSTTLRAHFAKTIGVDKNQVIATVGSDEGIRLISDTFVDSGEKVLSCDPTFSMYKEIAILSKGKYIGLKSDKEDLSPDIDEIIKVANLENVKVVYICTPNNPTGYLYKKEDIKKIIDNTSCIIAIDEAYIHFAEGDNLDLIDYSNRVIILRTLSKAFSGAGLRVGFLVANKETIKYLDGSKLPYNLSATSEVAGEVLLNNIDLIEKEVEVIKEERAKIVGVLKQCRGVFLFPINANFITLRSDKAYELYNKCEAKSISIRKYGNDLKNIIRISVGNKYENEELIKVIKEVYNEN